MPTERGIRLRPFDKNMSEQQKAVWISCLVTPLFVAGWIQLASYNSAPKTATIAFEVSGETEIHDRLVSLRGMSPISAIEHLARDPRAILFAHAEWSITSALAFRRLDEFAEAYLSQPGAPFVNFHIVEYPLESICAGEGQILSIGIKDAKKGGARNLFNGNGELAFVQNGKVIAVGMPLVDTDPVNEAVQWLNQLVGYQPERLRIEKGKYRLREQFKFKLGLPYAPKH